MNRRAFLQSLLALPAGAVLMPWGEIWTPKIMVSAAKIVQPYYNQEDGFIVVPAGRWELKDLRQLRARFGAKGYRALSDAVICWDYGRAYMDDGWEMHDGWEDEGRRVDGVFLKNACPDWDVVFRE